MYSSKFYVTRLACLMCLFVMTTTRLADALTIGTNDITAGPWLWMIAPTEPGRGGARSTDVDSLAAISGGQ